ncbi:MAG: hypothetical protein P1Q69_03690 [Candidatus Thorarchaeota archaeon]|nr:hypothetical protein [Candidatus Thorarchaeota archaeon]
MLRKELSEQDVTRLIIVLTAFAPFGTFSHGTKYAYETIIYSFIVTLRFYNGEFVAIQILDFWNLFTTSLIGIITIIFGVQIIKYIRGDASKWSVYLLGGLTLVIPIGLVIVTGIHDLLVYQGPIPIQMIVGLLIVRSFKITDKCWDGPLSESSVST